MDITPNLTLIVQMVNFGIAYWVIRGLLIKPAYTAIEAEKFQEQHIKSIIATNDLFITSLQQQVQQYHQASQQNLSSQIPLLHQRKKYNAPPSILIKDFSAHQIEQSVTMIADTITHKVLHGE